MVGELIEAYVPAAFISCAWLAILYLLFVQEA